MTKNDRTARLRILIVEDEALIAKELQDRLTRLGFETVAVADSADKAIQAVEQNRPNLVLMDIRLKGPRDGIETAGYIRQHLHIPVVYLTAHSDEATLKRAKDTAPFGYVLKPFQERELLVAIEMATHMHMLEQRISERTAELQQTVEKLQQALNEIKTLRGLIPICAWCKKIRNDTGYWEHLETYLRTHTEAEFSHGLCPECYEKNFATLLNAPSQE
ncbi:MAG: response regulator [Acidobacteria bacterium]|nr:response regulator [Acidobacteriota bacterium]